jgi:hypothetical protein
VAAFVAPSIAGYISGSVWLLIAIIPSIGFRLSNYYFYRGHYQRAYQLKRGLAWLHPLPDWRWQDVVFQAYIALDRGDAPHAFQLLQAATGTDAKAEQRLFYFAMSRQWTELLRWWQQHPQQAELQRQPNALRYYLLALGETGQLNALVATFTEVRPVIEQVALVLDYAQLYLFAFGGKVDETIALLNARFDDNLNPAVGVIWIATAHYAANHPELGRSLLLPLQRATQDGVVKFTLTQRLADEATPAATVLSPEAARQLDTIATNWLERLNLLAHWR